MDAGFQGALPSRLVRLSCVCVSDARGCSDEGTRSLLVSVESPDSVQTLVHEAGYLLTGAGLEQLNEKRSSLAFVQIHELVYIEYHGEIVLAVHLSRRKKALPEMGDRG